MNPVPIKPYLMRAIHEWCSDHGYTPYLVVAVHGKMQVPMEYVKNGEIVLNISYNATRNLHMGDDYVRFSARFGGVSRDIVIPVGAVSSLFAKESGEGMAWQPDAEDPAHGMLVPETDEATGSLQSNEAEPGPQDEPPPAPTGGRSHLRVVK